MSCRLSLLRLFVGNDGYLEIESKTDGPTEFEEVKNGLMFEQASKHLRSRIEIFPAQSDESASLIWCVVLLSIYGIGIILLNICRCIPCGRYVIQSISILGMTIIRSYSKFRFISASPTKNNRQTSAAHWLRSDGASSI